MFLGSAISQEFFPFGFDLLFLPLLRLAEQSIVTCTQQKTKSPETCVRMLPVV